MLLLYSDLMVTGRHVNAGDGMTWNNVTDVWLTRAARFFRENSLNELSPNLERRGDGCKG